MSTLLMANGEKDLERQIPHNPVGEGILTACIVGLKCSTRDAEDVVPYKIWFMVFVHLQMCVEFRLYQKPGRCHSP